MKLVGLLCCFVMEDWIEMSIRQGVEMVDELIVAIGPFNDFFLKLADKTEEIAEKFKGHEKIKFVNTVNHPLNSRKENRCATLNKMMLAADLEIGDVIWILDADEYFTQTAIKTIRDFISDENNIFDLITLQERYFAINMRYYVTAHHKRLYKIKKLPVYFTPTQFFHPKPKIRVHLLDDDPMFHYSLLTGEQIKGTRWMSDDLNLMFTWYRCIQNKYDPDDEENWKKTNLKITGNYGFYHKEAHFGEKEGGGLFRYNGPHPPIIENSPLIKIEDFREYMKTKPNYITYLRAIKRLVNKKKTLIYQFQRHFKQLLIRTFLMKNFHLRRLLKKYIKPLSQL